MVIVITVRNIFQGLPRDPAPVPGADGGSPGHPRQLPGACLRHDFDHHDDENEDADDDEYDEDGRRPGHPRQLPGPGDHDDDNHDVSLSLFGTQDSYTRLQICVA